jgi:hypothetical protein
MLKNPGWHISILRNQEMCSERKEEKSSQEISVLFLRKKQTKQRATNHKKEIVGRYCENHEAFA